MTRFGETAGIRRWNVRHLSGSAADLHATVFSAADGRSVWLMHPVTPAVVLGSTQATMLVNEQVATDAGVDIVGRRSGGGAVWLAPEQSIWVDLIIARDDPLWRDDVRTSMWWVGDAWVRALIGLGIGPGLAVHRSALAGTRWSRLVCFDSLGPGEVTLDGIKLVGISQRRTRDGARFQCVAYRRYDPALLLAVLNAPKPLAAELGPVATVPFEESALGEALISALP